jgi:hypothetical protein
MSSGIGGAQVRYPRVWLKIGGARMPCISAHVHRSGKRRSDTFDCELSITETERYGFGLAEWTDFDPQDATVIMSAAADGSDEREMLTGLIDMPSVSLKEMTVSVQGRDKSASLGEKQRREKFSNQKTKDIVEKVAKDHKLTAQVQLPDEGGEYAGKQYDQDTAHLALNRTDWELLDDLAEREGCRWYVDGKTLYFEPDDQSNGAYDVVWQPPGTAEAYTVANVLDIALKRNMTAGRPIKHSVSSVHHRLRKVFRAEASIPGVGDVLAYQDDHPGRTQKQVERLAKSRAKSLARHELGVVIRAPGDLSVDVRQDLNLSGTGTIYDQKYDIDGVDFVIEWGEGFGMSIQATNAKKGRDVTATTQSWGGKSVNQNGPATKTVPLPPQRPAELGGGSKGGVSL